MFDFDLQMRFWRNVTDAMLHSADASLAATSAWQDQVLASGTAPKARSAAVAPPFPMAFWPWMNGFQQTPQAVTPAWPQMWWLGTAPSAAAANPFLSMMPAHMTSMMTAMMPWADTYWRTAAAMGPQSPMAQMAKTMAPFWPWPEMTWSYMQMPLTAMMVSSGMPYSVASPSAKASTAAMDAADAARQQMDKVYSAYRSDGGHAAAQLVMMPWALAASFMDRAANSAT